MYEIKCIVGDKKLREVLVHLSANTLEPPVVIPVVEAPQTNGLHKDLSKAVFPKKKPKKPVQPGGKHLKGQGATAIVRGFIEQAGVSRVSAREIRQATIDAGYSKNAYSHAIKLLSADKTIRKIDNKGNYKVLSQPKGVSNNG